MNRKKSVEEDEPEEHDELESLSPDVGRSSSPDPTVSNEYDESQVHDDDDIEGLGVDKQGTEPVRIRGGIRK